MNVTGLRIRTRARLLRAGPALALVQSALLIHLFRLYYRLCNLDSVAVLLVLALTGSKDNPSFSLFLQVQQVTQQDQAGVIRFF